MAFLTNLYRVVKNIPFHWYVESLRILLIKGQKLNQSFQFHRAEANNVPFHHAQEQHSHDGRALRQTLPRALGIHTYVCKILILISKQYD